MSSVRSAPAIAKVMKGWQFTSASNGLENSLILNSAVPTPSPKRGQVLVQVTAAAVNPVDYKIAELPIGGRLAYGSPAIPSLDFAGRVVQSEAPSVVPGQRVFGRLAGFGKHGALGQFVVAAAAEVAALPDGVEDAAGVAAGTTALTALQYYVKGGAKAGDRVFVNGGSGGLGPWAIQIGKVLGCEVTTSCSTRNVELCKSLGADEVVDYTTQDLIAVLQSKGLYYDLVLDNVGEPEPLYAAADKFLKPTGKFIQVGSVVSVAGIYSQVKRQLCPAFLGNGSRSYAFMLAANSKKDFEQIAQWLADKKIKPVYDSKIDFANAPDAYKKLKTGHAQGRIVVINYPDTN